MLRTAGGLILFILAAGVFFIAGTNIWVVRSARDLIIEDPAGLPDYETALVLGTSNRTRAGKPNPFFNNRMDKAAQLYNMHKVDRFIVSGDNRRADYNEPEMMRKALRARGVPGSVIIPDRAGLRTFDSILRSKTVFGSNSLIVITQPFHAYRALFICKNLGIPAVAFVAREPGEYAGPQVYIREYFARTLAVLESWGSAIFFN
jgi:SanA protein